MNPVNLSVRASSVCVCAFKTKRYIAEFTTDIRSRNPHELYEFPSYLITKRLNYSNLR